MRVYVPATSPASTALLGALNQSGYTNVGIQGNFSLKVGTLALQLTYYQSMGIPNCALAYVRTHPGGGACGACACYIRRNGLKWVLVERVRVHICVSESEDCASYYLQTNQVLDAFFKFTLITTVYFN